jgi:small neutral amino acid transporter SnatA (MarC family)
MKIRVWIAFAVAAIAFAFAICMVLLESRIFSRLLQMSLTDEYIATGISLFVVTLGMVIGFKYYYAKRKK